MKLISIISIVASIFLITYFSALFGDMYVKGGSIINQSSGNLNFDLTNDGITDLTMSNTGKVGFGSAKPTSTFDLTGSLGFNSEIFSSDGTISGNSMVFGDTSGANITLTLPVASTVVGRIYQIKKISESNSLIITAAANIDKNSSVTLTTSGNGFPYLNVYSSGTQWFISSMSN